MLPLHHKYEQLRNNKAGRRRKKKICLSVPSPTSHLVDQADTATLPRKKLFDKQTMSSQTDNKKKLSFTATYSSPTNAPFVITHELQAPPSGTTNPTVPDKTKYLSSLREATATMQEQINKELTQRMEEDKACEASKNGGKTSKVVDDAKEEENYGEEAQEEED